LAEKELGCQKVMVYGFCKIAFVVPALAGLLLLCHWRIQPAEAGTTNVLAQKSPELPQIRFDNFGPGIREQVRKADEEAHNKPNDAAALARLAMVLHTYEEHELAAAVYQRVRKLQPNEFQWLYLLAICQSALGKTEEAIRTLRTALNQKADYLPAQLRLADVLFAAGELAESRKLYEAVAAKEPKTAHAHYGLGRVKARLKEATGAIESLTAACELSPSWGAAHYALAMAYRDLGNSAQSAEHVRLSQQFNLNRPLLADPVFQQVAELNASATERLRRGVELEAAGKLVESVAEHQQALKINPQLSQAHINLIQLYGRTQQPAKAEEHYQASVALNPNLAESHYNFGVLLLEQKRLTEAAQAFQRTIEINPQFAEARLNYGILLELQQQYDEAMNQYRLAVENRPNHREAHFQFARMLLYKNQLPEAIAQLQQTLTVEDGETPRYTFALAAAYARAGDKANAVKFARLARDKAVTWKQMELLAKIERDLKILEQER
jgi:tetratricopeptide (TPR) repeat protein